MNTGLIVFIIALILIFALVVWLSILFAPQLFHVLYYLFTVGATVFFEYTAFISAIILLLFPPFPPFVYLSNILALLLFLMSFWLTSINQGGAWILGPPGTRPPFFVIFNIFLAAFTCLLAAVQYDQFLLGIVSAAFFGLSFGLFFSIWPFPVVCCPCSFELWYREFRTFLLPSLLVLLVYALSAYGFRERAQVLEIGFVALNMYLFIAILVAFTLNRNLGKYRLANQAIFLIAFVTFSLGGQVDLAVFTILAWINYFIIAFFIYTFSLIFGIFLAIVSIVVTGALYALLLP